MNIKLLLCCSLHHLLPAFISSLDAPGSHDVVRSTSVSAAFSAACSSPSLRPIPNRSASPRIRLPDCSTHLSFPLETLSNPSPQRTGRDSLLRQPCLKGDDVTYLQMTLIRPGATWLSSEDKSPSSQLSFFLSSFISRCQSHKCTPLFRGKRNIKKKQE